MQMGRHLSDHEINFNRLIAATSIRFFRQNINPRYQYPCNYESIYRTTTFNRSSNKNTIGLQDVQSLNLEQKYVQFSR